MKNLDGILFSMPRETESIVQKILEVSQRRMPRETESTREKSFRTLKTNSDTMKASRKNRINSEDAFFDLDKIYGFINAGSIAHGTSYEKNLALFKNSEFENIKGLFGITRMMIEGNSEIKNVFLADVASSLWENPVLLKEQAIKWTKARVYVCSDSVLCLGKMRGPEDAVRRWNDQVSTLKVCPTFREL